MAGGHAWQGGMHGRGVCVVGVHGRGHAWQGACVVGGMHGKGGMHGGGGGCACHTCPPRHYEIWSVNVRVVRILLGMHSCYLIVLHESATRVTVQFEHRNKSKKRSIQWSILFL